MADNLVRGNSHRGALGRFKVLIGRNIFPIVLGVGQRPLEVFKSWLDQVLSCLVFMTVLEKVGIETLEFLPLIFLLLCLSVPILQRYQQVICLGNFI